jgi:AcrR family transcriptional regulator
MIHHYFGSKEGLYDAIIDEFTSATFEVPLRLIDKPPRTREEFVLRLEMFISETFRALLTQAPVFRIIARESKKFVGTAQYHTGLATYLSAAQTAEFLSADLKVELITGIVLDRLGGQIMYASRVSDEQPNVLNDEKYAEEWLNANTAVLIHGLAKSD